MPEKITPVKGLERRRREKKLQEEEGFKRKEEKGIHYH